MKSKQRFWLNILSYLILIGGVATGYWGISTTLFYFVIEAIISCSLAGYWFKKRGKKPAGIPGAIGAGIGAAMLTTMFTFYLCLFANELSYEIYASESPRLAFFIEMIILAWPLIIYKGITTYLALKPLDEKQLENDVWNEAIQSVMTIFFTFILTIFLIKLQVFSNALLIIICVLIAKIVFDLYLHREILGLSVAKKKK